MEIETINGLTPFKLKGDLGEFERTYIPYFFQKGFSMTDSRNLVTSIWLFGNDQWKKGYEEGKAINNL